MAGAVGRYPEGQVITLRPSEVVMATFVAGRSPVRELVPRQPGAAEAFGGHHVLIGLIIVMWMARRIGCERGAGFDGGGAAGGGGSRAGGRPGASARDSAPGSVAGRCEAGRAGQGRGQA